MKIQLIYINFIKGLVMMKNGIYLSLILFLGVMGYFVVNDLFNENSIMLASVVFLVVSVAIFVLTTHFKKKVELVPAQKIINVLYIGLFALYGVVTGLSLVYSPALEAAAIRFEGILFLVASAVLLYGLYVFMKRNVLHHA